MSVQRKLLIITAFQQSLGSWVWFSISKAIQESFLASKIDQGGKTFLVSITTNIHGPSDVLFSLACHFFFCVLLCMQSSLFVTATSSVPDGVSPQLWSLSIFSPWLLFLGLFLLLCCHILFLLNLKWKKSDRTAPSVLGERNFSALHWALSALVSWVHLEIAGLISDQSWSKMF